MKIIKIALLSTMLLTSNIKAGDVNYEILSAYKDEAVATLEYAGINSSDYFVECNMSQGGETAVCNAKANIMNIRRHVSVS